MCRLRLQAGRMDTEPLFETWNSEAVTQIWENHRKGGSAMFLWLEVSYVSDRAF